MIPVKFTLIGSVVRMLSMQVPLQFGLVWVTFHISGNNPYDVISSSNFFESSEARVSMSKLKSPIKYMLCFRHFLRVSVDSTKNCLSSPLGGL